MRISDWSSDVCSSDLHFQMSVVALGQTERMVEDALALAVAAYRHQDRPQSHLGSSYRMGFPRQRVTPPRSPGFKMLHRRDWSPAPQLQDMTKCGPEKALDEARLLELDGIRRGPPTQARPGPSLRHRPPPQTRP